MTNLSEKVLIKIEDRKKTTSKDLVGLAKANKIQGAIGKLEALRMIQKNNSGYQTTFSLTERGQDYLDMKLTFLHLFHQKWDKRWRVFVFNVPEIKRKTRDKLRLYLNEYGFSMLKSSVWITPFDIDKILQKNPIIKSGKISTILFYANYDSKIDDILFTALSSDKKAPAEISNFIEESKKITQMGDNVYQRFNAKLLIFEYSDIIKKYGILKYLSNGFSRLFGRADEYYYKLRKLIY